MMAALLVLIGLGIGIPIGVVTAFALVPRMIARMSLDQIDALAEKVGEIRDGDH